MDLCNGSDTDSFIMYPVCTSIHINFIVLLLCIAGFDERSGPDDEEPRRIEQVQSINMCAHNVPVMVITMVPVKFFEWWTNLNLHVAAFCICVRMASL